MNKKTKAEKIFILSIICICIFAVLCLPGCGDSCADCDWGCVKESDEYNIGGISCVSSSCTNSSSCITTWGSVSNMSGENFPDDELHILTCENSNSGCFSSSSCYNGCFLGDCDSCDNMGIVCGSEDGDDIEEKTYGCVNGEVSCADTKGIWGDLLDFVYALLDIGEVN